MKILFAEDDVPDLPEEVYPLYCCAQQEGDHRRSCPGSTSGGCARQGS